MEKPLTMFHCERFFLNEWSRRLEYVVKNGGGHIEHCNFVE